jgi:hypothetical protein
LRASSYVLTYDGEPVAVAPSPVDLVMVVSDLQQAVAA